MPVPRLTFFCELDAEALQELFTDQTLIEDLLAIKANISLGILDLSPQRAEVVKKLNKVDIPVNACLLLPREQGYWFNLDNATQSIARYQLFRDWTEEYNLNWVAVGLDIEPDIGELEKIVTYKWFSLPSLLRTFFRRILDRKRLVFAREVYDNLVSRIRADGYNVDSYQLPIIADERRVGSTFLQRFTGLVDLPVDREIWMLYSSFLRPKGVGYLWSYAPEAQSIGLGSTGGGVYVGFGDRNPLDWDELSRDLLLSWYWTDDIHIFSLEGCVQQGFIERLKTFEWDRPILFPDEIADAADVSRKAIQSILWITSHFKLILVGLLGIMLSLSVVRRLRRK